METSRRLQAQAGIRNPTPFLNFYLKLVRYPRFDSCAPAHCDLSVCPSMSLASPRLHSRSYPRHLPSMSRALRRSIPPFLLFPSHFLLSSWCLETKKPPRHSCARRLLVDSFNLCQVEGIERRLVDYRRHSKPLIGLVSGERFPSQRSEQSIHITCVIAHLL